MSEMLRSELELAVLVNVLLIVWIAVRELKRWRTRPTRPVCLLKYPTPPINPGPDDRVLVCINRAGLYLSSPPHSTAPPLHVPIGKAVTFRVTDDGEFRIERSNA